MAFNSPNPEEAGEAAEGVIVGAAWNAALPMRSIASF